MAKNLFSGSLDTGYLITQIQKAVQSEVALQMQNQKLAQSQEVVAKTTESQAKATKDVSNTTDTYTKKKQQATNRTNEMGAAIKKENKLLQDSKYSWKQALESYTTYLTVTNAVLKAKDSLIDMVVQVKDLDSALLELRKVTDLEGASLDEFTKKAYDAAEGVAKTGTEMVQAATEFAKSGYDENQSLELGKVALMYTNIADEEISAADSAGFIIAQMKAFNIEAKDSIHIIDAVNEVANKYAVSSADIASNIGKSSAVMANAGNSMEQTIGLLTAGTEVTRNASKIANGLKTITLRLQENFINPWYVQKCA